MSTLTQQDERTTTDLAGRTCVVTGGSRGIGRHVAESLGRRGANVVVNYRSSRTAATDVAETIQRGAGTALPAQADVADPADVEAMAARVHDEFGPVDVLVNNAGVTVDGRFDEMTHADWKRVQEVNVDGTFHCTRAFYDDIKAAEHGRLVNVSSVVAQQGNYGQANYAASKSALFGFTRSLAQELAPHGSTANCVAPGYTRTDMVEAVREDIQERIRDGIPMGRFAAPEEVAAAVGFLASDEAGYITGEVLNVNGGLYS